MSRARWKVARKLVIGLLVAVLMPGLAPCKPGNPHREIWRSGDVIFLNGNSFRSRFVRLLQGYDSDYSHVGIVVVDKGVPFVVHADPGEDKVVKQRWDVVLSPGEVCGGALYRPRPGHEAAVREACDLATQWAHDGVPFDHEFDLKTADKLYCTELVWRAYRSARLNLCKDAETQHRYLLPSHLLHSPELEAVLQF